MKKILSIFAAAIFAVGLTACSTSAAETVINEVADFLNVSGGKVEVMDSSAETSYLTSLSSSLSTENTYVITDQYDMTESEKTAFTTGYDEFQKFVDLVETPLGETDAYGYGVFVNNECNSCAISAELKDVNLSDINFDAINEMFTLMEADTFFYGNGTLYFSANGDFASYSTDFKAIVDKNAQ